jgi:hypothetical protein
MEANELRIGNLVKLPIYLDESESVHEITGVDTEHPYVEWVTFDYLEWNEVKPILLNENWLEILGFELSYDSKYRRKYDLIGDYRFGYDLNKVESKDGCASGVRFKGDHFRLKYVHQLQNLYFALTGEELNTNPN